MARYLRNRVVLAKLETTYGTDPTPTGGSNAIVFKEGRVRPFAATNVPRDLVRGYFGASRHLVGIKYVEIELTVEMTGAGTATTAPPWAPLVQACGFAGAATAGAYELTPTSTLGSNSSVTIYYYLDGELHKATGCRGTFTIDFGVGNVPVMKFRFMGIYNANTAASNASPTVTSWRTPLIVMDANTDGVWWAPTYTASTGSLSTGSAFQYNDRGIQIDIGNTLVFQALLGEERVEITQREISGSISLALSASQAVNFDAAVVDNDVIAMGLTHGTDAGDIVVLYMPKVQRVDPDVEDFNGEAMRTYKLHMTPNSGNDEIRIVTR